MFGCDAPLLLIFDHILLHLILLLTLKYQILRSRARIDKKLTILQKKIFRSKFSVACPPPPTCSPGAPHLLPPHAPRGGKGELRRRAAENGRGCSSFEKGNRLVSGTPTFWRSWRCTRKDRRSVFVYEREREIVCDCVCERECACVCVTERECVCVCLCVWLREK